MTLRYVEIARGLLDRIEQTQEPAVRAAADLFADRTPAAPSPASHSSPPPAAWPGRWWRAVCEHDGAPLGDALLAASQTSAEACELAERRLRVVRVHEPAPAEHTRARERLDRLQRLYRAPRGAVHSW